MLQGKIEVHGKTLSDAIDEARRLIEEGSSAG